MESPFNKIDKIEKLSEKEEEELSLAFTDFYRIIKTLRGPDGCPWDRTQTPESLAPNLIEESYELVEAIDNDDIDNIREEIGDIFLVAGMIASIHAEQNRFTLTEVLSEVSDKLVRRHPHVFGDEVRENPDEVVELWNHIKKNVEKDGGEFESMNDSIPRSLPPLERAYKIQKKVGKVGFDWEELQQVKDKLAEELAELEDCTTHPDEYRQDKIEEEVGDVLFSIINLSRHLKIDPAVALHKTNQKFVDRFRYIEQKMHAENRTMDASEFDRMDELWEEAKLKLKDM